MVKNPLKERYEVMDKSNMETCKKSSIYHPSKENKWTGINWSKIEKTIDDLQHQITKATERGLHRAPLSQIFDLSNSSPKLKSFGVSTKFDLRNLTERSYFLAETPATRSKPVRSEAAEGCTFLC